MAAVPDALRHRRQWLTWRLEAREDVSKKPLKVPYYANGVKRFGQQGTDDDRARLVTMDEALAAVARSAGRPQPLTGIGFAFLPNDGLIGIDIDKCIDDDGVISPLASEIIARCDSYTEYSPSRRGVHIITAEDYAGQTTTFKSNKMGVEVFCSAQYFTFTGVAFPGTASEIRAISDDTISWLREVVRGPSAADKPVIPPLPLSEESDRARLESALMYVPADVYNDWINVGLALYHTLGDSGFSLFDYWSSRSSKYDGSEGCFKKWQSFGRVARDRKLSSAVIFKLACERGWSPGRKRNGKPTAQPTHPLVKASPKLDSNYSEPGQIDEDLSDEPPEPLFIPDDFPAPHHEEAGGSVEPREADEQGEGELFRRYALIIGTTDVWDIKGQQRFKKLAFEAHEGKANVKVWWESAAKKKISKSDLPVLIGGAAAGGGAGDRLDEMLENLTLLRGTETVWDMIGRQVMTLGAVRADYTPELTSRWQEHPLRKTVEQKNLVFDPTMTVDPETHVNIFFGMPMRPKENLALVDPIIELVNSLCSAEDNMEEVVQFVLKWMAFPLQHVGAKMQTALLFFGSKQGTGKSLLFASILRPIYGEYGTMVGQHQLDSNFTDWRSRKLFTLFEEVLSRDDKYSHNGTLKLMITGDKMQVNPKNLPLREEANHMNSVFLSNEPQPIPIELEDRRFLVVHARQKQDKEFYDRVVQSINNGGIEAFYHYLLNFPLGDFNEHTKPPMTRAKERVIGYGRHSWDAFHWAWKEGMLEVPYVSCLTSDAYAIYKRWCERNGEKPVSHKVFSESLVERGVDKAKKEVSIDAEFKRSKMVFLIDPLDKEHQGKSLHEQCSDFRKLGDVRTLGC